MSTKIEWTDSTWNPVSGCSKLSSGCTHCYAERMTRRLQGMGQKKYEAGFDKVQIHPNTLDEPRKWKKPRMVFVNSMPDLFHHDIPLSFIQDVFKVMRECPQHVFQVLTKRAERLAELSSQLVWPDNVWMGVTIENHRCLNRLEHLKLSNAKVKFLSLEPLLEALPNLDLSGIDWVIVGGESGPGARPMEVEWVREIRDNCIESQTPFFFKQWGGKNKKEAGRMLDGRNWDETPFRN